MTKRLKLAVLDMQPIDPAIGGGRLRLLGLYSGLTNALQATYVGTYDWRGPGFRDHMLSPCLREINIPLSEEHFAAHDELSTKIGKSCIDTAFPMQGHLSRDFVSRVQEETRKADVVILSHPWVYPFALPAIDRKRQLLIYDSQNVEAMLRISLLDDGTEETDKLLREAVRTEYELCHAADLILACSEEDKNNFARFLHVPQDKITVVPNGVFSSKIKPCKDPAHKGKLRAKLGFDKPVACFIGSAYYPNEEAARLIIEMAGDMPGFQFVIIGGVGGLVSDVDFTLYSNVTVTGFVEEQEKLDYLAASDIAINPMLSGSGTNIKMFDYMAAGLPIIATETGARGIPNTNGKLYLLCDSTASDLKSKILKLFNDKELFTVLQENGIDEASDKYNWEKISERLGIMLEKEYDRKASPKSRVLMVSTYPPEKCGIGAYAYQQVEFLRKEGHWVDTFALKGNGKYRYSLDCPEKLEILDALAARYDKVIMQYHTVFYYDDDFTVKEEVDMHRAWTQIFNRHKNIEVVIHEVKYPCDGNQINNKNGMDTLVQSEKRKKWQEAASITFHTQTERAEFCEKLDIPLDIAKMKVIPHNSYYAKMRDISQREARAELGIPLDKTMFLCIGFIQESKGFDQAAEAFMRLKKQKSKVLYIVGSMRFVDEENLGFLYKLRAYDKENENITFIEEFVSDKAFDTWISASDFVIIPYRVIFSSAVLERAGLFGKKCIVHDVGGLKEQMKEGDILFADYNELAQIIKRQSDTQPERIGQA